MKFDVPRSELLEALGPVMAVIPSRAHKEVLRCVRIEAGEGVVLTGTDEEAAAKMPVVGPRVDRSGEAVVTASMLHQIVREIPGETVSLEVEGGALVVSSGLSEFRIQLFDTSGFPAPMWESDETAWVVKAGPFREALRSAISATSTDSARFSLNGVCLEFPKSSGGTISVVATDTRRLAVSDIGCDREGEPTAGEGATIIPIKAVNAITSALGRCDDDGDEVRIVRGRDIQIQHGGFAMRTRLLDGQFPKWHAVILPAFGRIEVLMPCGELSRVVRQAQICSSDESRGCDFSFTEGSLEVRAASPSVGSSRAAIPADFGEESPISIRIDPKFVLDFLKSVPQSESVTWFMIDADQQIQLEHGNKRYVVMPLSKGA